jgi:ABC-type glutathione transport system ATPase component
LPLSLAGAGAELTGAVESSLRSVNLWNNKVGDKQARQYSGGMKRRLSVAISFMGDPLVVYLDEPSTVGQAAVGPSNGASNSSRAAAAMLVFLLQKHS